MELTEKAYAIRIIAESSRPLAPMIIRRGLNTKSDAVINHVISDPDNLDWITECGYYIGTNFEQWKKVVRRIVRRDKMNLALFQGMVDRITLSTEEVRKFVEQKRVG